MNFNFIISNILFPGIIFHELAHVIACLLLGVKIKKIKWVGKDGGFVEHLDSNSWKMIIIALIPFFFNILLSLLFARFYIFSSDILLKTIYVWLALSALFFCLPSKEDAQNVFDAIKKQYSNFKLLNILINIIISPLTIFTLLITFLFRIIDRSLFFRVFIMILWCFLFLF